MTIRPERPADAEAIRALTAAAFAGLPHSDGSEPRIIESLRQGGDLVLSLVTELVAEQGEIVGHIAFSPVTITDGSPDWFGLGPLSVAPRHQRRGIGASLARQGIATMRERGAHGIVLLGDPAYYERFGFAHDPALVFPGPPARYFQRLVLSGNPPTGIVRYAPGFA